MNNTPALTSRTARALTRLGRLLLATAAAIELIYTPRPPSR